MFILSSQMVKSLLDLVGKTPLLEIRHKKAENVKLFAKLEWQNPSGSVKDRAVKFMVLDALRKNLLVNKILIEATSGNTGIAFAMMGAELDIAIELALPENASDERKRILENYGAKVHLTDPLEGTDGAQKFVVELVKQHPDKYYYPDQYNNDNNWKAHFKTTGPEIWKQTKQHVTHFITGLGTTGTFIGTSRYLKPKGVTCISVQPNNALHGLEGWKHLKTAMVPGFYDESVADQNVEVDTEDAFRYAIAAAKFLGLHLSPSAAANLVAALKLAETLDSGMIVTVFPDNAFKYLRDPFWSNHDYFIKDPFI